MILYNAYEHEGQSLAERFPPDILGRRWLDTHLERFRNGFWDAPSEPPTLPPNSSPRLFVSHRRADRECASRVAWLADGMGFDVWLDVLDPILSNDERRPDALEVATVIEVALLNSTHVCAVITPNTQGSQWVPYEYGRVKDGNTLSDQAACCVRPDTTKLPEYLHLGVTHLGVVQPVEDELCDWLGNMCKEWRGRCNPARPRSWPSDQPEPPKLWDPCRKKDEQRQAST